MRTDPVWQRLCQRCLSIGIARRAEHCDEDLRRRAHTRNRIGQPYSLTGIVHEELFTRSVDLSLTNPNDRR